MKIEDERMIPAARESTFWMGDPEDDDEDEEKKNPAAAGFRKPT